MISWRLFIDVLGFQIKLWCCYFGFGATFSKIGRNLFSFWSHWGGLSTVSLLIKIDCFVTKAKTFSKYEAAGLNLFVWGGQPYWAFPFSKGSLVWLLKYHRRVILNVITVNVIGAKVTAPQNWIFFCRPATWQTSATFSPSRPSWCQSYKPFSSVIYE
jgi:hypothetical protein